MFEGGTTDLQLKAAVISHLNRGAQAKHDQSEITVRTAYFVLGSTLTLDPSKALLYPPVYFDTTKFEEERVLKIFNKLSPYDAGEFGVKIGTKFLVGSVEGKVKGVKHDRAIVEVGGKSLEKTVHFVLQHALGEQGVTRLEEAQRKFLLFLQDLITITHIHGPKFITSDEQRTHNENGLVFRDFAAEIAKMEDTLSKASTRKWRKS